MKNKQEDQKMHPITPVYSTSQPNQPIELGEFAATITAEGRSEKTSALLEFCWYPHPAVYCLFKLPASADPLLSDHCSILFDAVPEALCARLIAKLLSDEQKYRAQILNSDFRIEAAGRGFMDRIFRWFRDLCSVSSSASEVKFHVPNFRHYIGFGTQSQSFIANNRLSFLDDKYHCVMDAVREETSISTQMNAEGGYGILHCCQFGRADGRNLLRDEILAFRETLQAFLSLLNGDRIFLILPVAYSKRGKPKFVLGGGAPELLPIRKRTSFFPMDLSDTAQTIFPLFTKTLSSEIWGKPMKIALAIYLQSNSHEYNASVGIVQNQLIFENLAFVKLTEIDGMSPNCARQQQAETKIENIIDWAGLDTSIPTTLSNLQRAAEHDLSNVTNAPQALVRIRNLVAHPKKDAPVETTSRAAFEAWQLGLFYVERLFLHIMEYRGMYRNRLTGVDERISG